MPTYIFLCDDCELYDEVYASLKDGPPNHKCLNCNLDMYQDFSASGGFILKGSGWAGKDIKRENGGETSAEESERYMSELDDIENEQAEVLNERRKGSAHMLDYCKHNKNKMRRYFSRAKKFGFGDTRTGNKDT